MATRIDIGIDGGGSGCRVAISVDGGEITETRGGAANVVTDPAAAEAAIREALLTALKTHGLRLEHMTRARRLRRSCRGAPARRGGCLRHAGCPSSPMSSMTA